MKKDNLLPTLLILLLLQFCYCAAYPNATLQHDKDKLQSLTQPILPFQGQITAASLKPSTRVEISGGGGGKTEPGEERGLRRRSAKSSGSSGGGGTGGVGGKGGGRGTSEGGGTSQSIRQPRENRKSWATRSTSPSCSLRRLVVFRLVLFSLLLRR